MTTLRLVDLRKSFGRTHALAGLTLELSSGEIVGIAGPNGAGKSTLVRIISGEERRDSGAIELDGETVEPTEDPSFVAVVHQEPQSWLDLSLGENILVGRESHVFGWPRPEAREREAISRLGLEPWVRRQLRDCTLAVRQRAEIARAVAAEASCFLFDEPNSALTDAESQALFELMHQLAESGSIVVLISHRLGELVRHCGRIVVVRDGRITNELSGDRLTEPNIAAELVVSSDAKLEDDRRGTQAVVDSHRPALHVDRWTDAAGAFVNIELDVARGEIVSVVGVEGSGAREMVESLAGYRSARGNVAIEGRRGKSWQMRSTAFLPADRKAMLFPNLTVGDNLVVRLGTPVVARRISGFLRRRRRRTVAVSSIRRFGVRTEGPDQQMPALSGGNQQKVAIAAALLSEPEVLVCEEPTRGVDVGSKAEIYSILRDSARSGLAVVVFCTEVPEVYELADRVLVVSRGSICMDARVADFADPTALAEAIATAEEYGVADMQIANRVGR